MKRVITLLVCIVFVIGALASCENIIQGGEQHTHTFSDTWSSDAEGHWYEPTCECEDIEIKKLGHADANNDGACDVCTFTNHTHTYSDEWTVDCTNHWHAADCGHIVAGSDVEEHEDTDSDGICDTCRYVIEDIHEHYYSSEWTGDADYHWHAALCEHKVESSDYEAHNLDAAGYCTVCDAKVREIDKTSIEAVLAAAVARNHKVIDGNVTASEIVYGGSGNNLAVEAALTNEVFFVLGNGHSYVFYKTFEGDGEYVGGDHQWYEQISEDEVFGVQMEADSYVLEVISGDVQFLNGYTYIPGSLLPSDSYDTSTLANTLSAIYALGKAGVNVDNFEESYDAETGKYSVSFTYFSVNATTMSDDTTQYQVELYDIDIEFSVDENSVIYLAEFVISSYRNWEMDNDINYNPLTNTVTMRNEANPSVYAYSVSQRSGERTYTTPYPKSTIVPVDFELSYVTGTDYYDESGIMYITSEELITDGDGDGIVDLELEKDEYVRLHLSSLVPYTAIASVLSIDDFEITFVNNDDTKVGVLWKDQDFLRPSYSGYMDCITFKVADAGEYTLTIKFGDVTKAVSITVPGEAPIFVPDDTADTKYVQTTDTYGWFDNYTFTATESGTYTFTVPENLGIWLETSDAPDIDFTLGSLGGQVSFDLAAGGSIDFQVGAQTKGVWAIGVSFVAGEVDSDDEGGSEGGIDLTNTSLNPNGYNSNNTADVKYVYTAPGEGTLSFSFGGFVMVQTGNITYTVNGGAVQTLEAGVPVSLNLVAGDELVIIVIANGGYSTIVTSWTGDSGSEGGDDDQGGSVTPPVGESDFEIGDNTITVTDADIAAENIEMTLVVIKEGTYSFSSNSLMAQICSSDGMLISRNEAYLEVGTYVIKVVTSYITEAGDYTLTLKYTAPSSSSDGDGSEGDPYVIESLPTDITINSDTENKTYYVFTATESGTVVITYPAGNTDSWVDIFKWVNGQADGSDGNSASVYMTNSLSLEVEAGAMYRIGLGTWTNAGEVTINVSFGTGSEGGGSDDDDIGGSTESDGTEENPFVLDATGDYTCAFPGGYTPVWYIYEVTSGGYITLSSDFATPWLQVGLGIYSTDSNVDNISEELASSVTVYVPAGATVYIGVGDYNEKEADVDFSVSFEAFESDPIDNLVGEWSAIQSVDGWEFIYTITINADGTGTYSEDYGYYASEYDVTYIVVDGSSVLIGYEDEYSSGKLLLTYADNTLTYVPDAYSDPIVFAVSASDNA